jgi:1-phosphatidylinositol-4-phosphate 5-kinase
MLDHKNTLLQRFFGLHIMFFNGLKMHFVIMNNVFLTNVKIHFKYDLKGSLFQRISRDPRKDNYDDYDFNIPMKDLDLLERKFKFNLGKEESETIINQIQNDSSFLASKNINDYSFLIGIHDIGNIY